MSERRFKGYNTNTKHGFFGTFTLWEFIAVLGTGILASALTNANGATPMLYAAAGSTVALLVVLFSRRTLSNYPRLFGHLYSYLNRADYYHVKPERNYTPVLSDTRQRKR